MSRVSALSIVSGGSSWRALHYPSARCRAEAECNELPRTTCPTLLPRQSGVWARDALLATSLRLGPSISRIVRLGGGALSVWTSPCGYRAHGSFLLSAVSISPGPQASAQHGFQYLVMSGPSVKGLIITVMPYSTVARPPRPIHPPPAMTTSTEARPAA